MDSQAVPIGELARRTGLSADSLRHYERRGLLPAAPRTAGGARRFSPLTERQVRAIQAALGIGFALWTSWRSCSVRGVGGFTPASGSRHWPGPKLEALDRRIAELRAVRRTLAVTLEDWERRLASSGDSPAGLLDSLADAPPIARPNPRRKRSVKR